MASKARTSSKIPVGHCRVDKFIQLPREQRDCFIDTGAYLGESLANALDDGFRHVVGIEIHDGHYAECRRRFAGDDRVTLHHGSSHELLLEALLAHRTERVVLWLDAHYQGTDAGELCREAGEWPVLEEIRQVLEAASSMTTLPVLLIDDCKTFFDEFWNGYAVAAQLSRSQWPTYEQVVAALGERYETRLDTDESQVLVCTEKRA